MTVVVEDLDPRPNQTLIFSEIKTFFDKQYAQMDALDTQAGLIAATSTALTAGFWLSSVALKGRVALAQVM